MTELESSRSTGARSPPSLPPRHRLTPRVMGPKRPARFPPHAPNCRLPPVVET
jgi:hypothetical protein